MITLPPVNRTVIFFMIAFVLFAGGFIAFITGGFRYNLVDIARQAEVIAGQTQSGFVPKKGGSPESIIDNDSMSWWYGQVDNASPNWVQLSWKTPMEVDKISIDFGGGRYAVDYSIQTALDGEWEDRVVIKANQKDFVSHDIRSEAATKIRKLRLNIAKTRNEGDRLQRVNDIYAYHREAFLGREIFLFSVVPVLARLFKSFLFSFVFLLMLFAPGYVAISSFRSIFTREERFTLSFSVTIFFVLLLSILWLATRLSGVLWILPVIAVLSLAFIRNSNLRNDLQLTDRSLLYGVFASLCFLVGYGFLITKLGYSFQGDFLIPLGYAKIFMQNIDLKSVEAANLLHWSQIGDRTPLLGLLSIPFLAVFEDTFFTFQMLSMVVVSIFFASFFLLSQRMFDRRVAAVAVLFFLINPYFIYYAFSHQHRWLTIYFLFLFFYFLMDPASKPTQRTSFCAGFCAGLAYLTHPMSSIYVGCGLLYGAYRYRLNVFRVAPLFLATMVGLVLPWLLWVKLSVQGEPSVMFLSPFSIQGPPALFRGAHDLVMTTFFNTPLTDILMIRVWNVANTFLFDVKSGLKSPGNIDFYIYTLTGAVSLSLLPFAILGFVKAVKHRAVELLSFAVGPALILVLVISGWYVTNTGIQMQPVAALIVMVALYGAVRAFKTETAVLMLYNVCLLEHLFVLWVLRRDVRPLLSVTSVDHVFFSVLLGLFLFVGWHAANGLATRGFLANRTQFGPC